jgi:DNA-binding response OmpR family regulator
VTKSARRPRSLLVLAPATDVDGLQRELGSEAFELIVAETTAAAASTLRNSPIEAVIVSPEAPIAWIDELLAAIDQTRPRIPVLIVRHRNAEEQPGWRARGVGVLRQPLLPEALARSVDAVLALPRI